MSKTNVAVAGKKNTVLLAVVDLKVTYIVRKTLNEDRVLQFMELYEAGADVPPIEVVRDTIEIHDGRHRAEALRRLGRKHVECMLVEPGEHTEMLLDAFGKNFGGSLPPSRNDVVFVMKQLLDASTPHKKIQELFERFYKPSHSRKLLKDAVSSFNQAKLSRAMNAVAHSEVTVAIAAKEFGVNPEILQQELTGVKRKRRATSISEIKVEISNRHRGNTQRTVSTFRDLLEKFEDGEVRDQNVLEVLLHVQRLNSQAARRVDQWIERLNALKGSMKTKS